MFFSLESKKNNFFSIAKQRKYYTTFFVYIFLSCLFLSLVPVSDLFANQIALSGRNRCGFKSRKPAPPVGSGRGGGGMAKWEKKIKKKPHKKLKLIESHIIGKFTTSENFREDPRAINGILKFIDAKPGFGVKQFTVGFKDPSLNKIARSDLVIDGLDDTVARLSSSGKDVQTFEQIYHPNPRMVGQIDDNAFVLDIVVDRGENTIYDYLALFINGHQELRFTDEQRNALKDYILSGGFVYISACCGYRPFERGVHKEFKRMFPNKKFEPLPETHPVFKSYYKLDKFKYTGKEKVPNGKPYLEGLNVGCRTAVFFSPYDFCCAWDGHIHGDQDPYASDRELGMETSLQLGANLISYSLGYRDLSKPLKRQVEYVSSQKRKRSDFVFAQVKHTGDWDPDPMGTSNLLQHLSKETNMQVYPNRRVVRLDKTDIFKYPFLYMTGHNMFDFSAEVNAKMKSYFEKGGFLFADACCGEKKFNKSFISWIKKIFPKNKIRKIPLNHPIYTCFYDVRKVQYTELTKKGSSSLTQDIVPAQGEERTPIWSKNKDTVKANLYLSGVFVDGRLVCVYSPYDIGCGWEKSPCLMCRGLDHRSGDSFKVATNVVVYALSGE